VRVDAACAGYCQRIMDPPLMREWLTAARAEPDELEELDVEF
jgi:glutathione S-transferase